MPSQWNSALFLYGVSHWLGANLESALKQWWPTSFAHLSNARPQCVSKLELTATSLGTIWYPILLSIRRPKWTELRWIISEFIQFFCLWYLKYIYGNIHVHVCIRRGYLGHWCVVRFRWTSLASMNEEIRLRNPLINEFRRTHGSFWKQHYTCWWAGINRY